MSATSFNAGTGRARNWWVGVVAGMLVAVGVHAQAAAVTPDALVRSVTNQVLEIVRNDKEIRGGNAERAIDLVQAKVLPHFDFSRMTALVLGRFWRTATPVQKRALTDEFRTLLVRTYSTALTQYRNQTIEYLPMAVTPTDTDATVRTLIRQPGADPIALDYDVEKVGAAWKVYDIEVDGVSLVTNYRDQFARQISDSGIDGLIARLRTRNAAGMARTASRD
jgi:phospholipid transport system substrate-binding protein